MAQVDGELGASEIASILVNSGADQCVSLELPEGRDTGLQCFVFCVDLFFHALMHKYRDGGGDGVDVNRITPEMLEAIVKMLPRAGVQPSMQLMTGPSSACCSTDTLNLKLRADGWDGEWDAAPTDLPVQQYVVECALRDVNCSLRFRPSRPQCQGG